MADNKNLAPNTEIPVSGPERKNDSASQWLDHELRDLRATALQGSNLKMSDFSILEDSHELEWERSDDEIAIAIDDGISEEILTVELDEDSLASQGASFTYQSLAPPERVRFAAPVNLRPEDQDRTVEGAIVNLSVQGIACLIPADFVLGQRIWASFNLNLGEKPLVILCEVIWSQPPQQQHRAFGLRFFSLTRTETEQLREAVRERTEGRAGAWPLPVMPAEPTPSRPVKGTSPWLSAAAGMAAGIGLTLALSVIPKASIGQTSYAPGSGRVADPVAPPVHQVVPVKIAPDREPAANDGSASIQPEPTMIQHEDVSAPEPAPLPEREPLGEPLTDDILRPLSNSDSMPLALLTDGPVNQHISFWLTSPRRLVIDVPGRQSGFPRNSYVIDHPLATRLRVGNHPGKVRFVIETSADVQPEVITERRGSSLAIELRRQNS